MLAEDPSCLYVKPPEARPEPPLVSLAHREVNWEPEARALLERIPAFVRATVKARLEEHAAREGRECITLDFMRDHRPPIALLSRASSQHLPPGAAVHCDLAKGG